MIDPLALPRLLLGTPGAPFSLDEHEAAFATTFRPRSLDAELEASGLTGRGGAGFPTHQKARLVREQHGRHRVVVVNAMEGEPAAHKDAVLLSANPHLVLDGAEILASIIGAEAVVVCVARDNLATQAHVSRAIDERRARTRVEMELRTPPGRYVAGEESALVHWLNDRETLPQYRTKRPHVLRVNRHPVLVDNAETCAHVGLIGRFGARWFRALGTPHAPGSTLVSASGAVREPVVLEVALGTPLRAVLDHADAEANPQALLLGGFGGTWIDAEDLEAPYEPAALSSLGATIGAGVIVALGHQSCGLLETQRIAAWMAHESARQCGPCAFGLPALAEDLALVGRGGRDASAALTRLQARCSMIEGRGACRHPDGVVRLVRSALKVFRDDLERHVSGLGCRSGRSPIHALTLPRHEHELELQWQ